MINEKIVLASQSPRRKELISLIADNVSIRPADCDETLPEGISPREAVEYLSKIKNDAAREISQADDIVVSADTVVAVDDIILGKPADKDDARYMIALLQGRVHSVYTGVTISRGDSVITFSEKTDVEFNPMTEAEIEEYILDSEPYDKAGSYAVQGKACVYIKGLNGDYFNVVGLPVSRLYNELRGLLNN
ncbi:MAG: septum formation protein Maf [Clostridia bacterium]|nr:septum formation protein Maf [Clostridia bacterium]